MKVGICGKTIPHFNYILRQDKYEDRQDLQYSESGNMPDWANEPSDFWNACAVFERKRSYRELEFAIPNELSREEQIQLVQEYIKQIIPDKPYTFAIHEVNSSIHGIKNPHVHLMFSERPVNEYTKTIERDTFFKKSGIDRSGNIYGGVKKDRSWAGNKETSKIYEVRETLENIINAYYKKNNLDVTVSSKTLEKQQESKLFSGNIEKRTPYTKKVTRIGEKVFRSYMNVLQTEIHTNSELNLDNKDVETRIYQERQRILAQTIHSMIDKHNQSLEPTEQERKDAIILASRELANLKRFYKSPFSIVKKQLQLEETSESNDEITYSVLSTSSKILEQKQQELISSILMQKETNSTITTESIQAYQNKTKGQQLALFVNEKTNGEYKKIVGQLRSQKSLLDYAKKKGNPTDILEYQVSKLEAEKQKLFTTTMTKQSWEELAHIRRLIDEPIINPTILVQTQTALQQEETTIKAELNKLENIHQNQLIIKLVDERSHGLYSHLGQELSKQKYLLAKLEATNTDTSSIVDTITQLTTQRDLVYKEVMNIPENKNYIKEQISIIKSTIQQHKTKLDYIQDKLVTNQEPRIKIVADLVYNRDELAKQLEVYKHISPTTLQNKFINEQTQGAYDKLLKEINSKERLIQFNKKQGNSTKALENELDALRLSKQQILNRIMTDPQNINIVEEAKRTLADNIKHVEQAIEQIDAIKKMTATGMTQDDWNKIREQVTKTKRVQSKHKQLYQSIQSKANANVVQLEQVLDVYQKANQPIDYFVKEEINQLTKGEYNRIQEQIKIQLKALETARQEQRPAEELQQIYKTVESLQSQAQQLEFKYITPTVTQRASDKKRSYIEKRKGISIKSVRKKAHKTARRVPLSDKLKKALSSVDKATGASHIRTDRNQNIESMNEL